MSLGHILSIRRLQFWLKSRCHIGALHRLGNKSQREASGLLEIGMPTTAHIGVSGSRGTGTTTSCCTRIPPGYGLVDNGVLSSCYLTIRWLHNHSAFSALIQRQQTKPHIHIPTTYLHVCHGW